MYKFGFWRKWEEVKRECRNRLQGEGIQCVQAVMRWATAHGEDVSNVHVWVRQVGQDQEVAVQDLLVPAAGSNTTWRAAPA